MRLVSVIIPAYNPDELLLAALESVYAQSYEIFEISVINDGSKDECAIIFSEALRKYPTLIIHHLPINRGVAAARNFGAAKARGEYLAFLDQDDVWTPEKLELQTAYLDTNPDIDYITSRQRYFLAEGVNTAPTWVKPEHIDTSLPGFLPGTLMVRASAFKKLNGFDENLKAGTDDVDWFFRAHASGLKTHQLPQELLHKRIHQKNLSRSAQAHNKELLSVVRMNLERRKQS